MSSFGAVGNGQHGWQASLGGVSPALQERVDALVQGSGLGSTATSQHVSISAWPATDRRQVAAIQQRMVRAVFVCILSSICATLAIVALVAFAHSGWEAVHPWVSFMALVGSLGLFGIGLGILLTSSQLRKPE